MHEKVRAARVWELVNGYLQGQTFDGPPTQENIEGLESLCWAAYGAGLQELRLELQDLRQKLAVLVPDGGLSRTEICAVIDAVLLQTKEVA